MNRKILWISYRVPYDKVAHAGGQIHNYYLKQLKKENDDIFLITQSPTGIPKDLDLEEYGIKYKLFVRKNGWKDFFWKLLNLETKTNIFNRYAGLLYNSEALPVINELKRLQKENFCPNVIILQWTQMILLVDYVKKCFPDAKVIAVEEDVSFLKLYRKQLAEKNFLKKYVAGRRYSKLKYIELSALNKADLAVFNNQKDRNLVKDSIGTKTFVWAPYFYNMAESEYDRKNENILFYGAMSRKENQQSAVWFIENVLPKLKDIDVKFIIIGTNPSPKLKKYSDSRVIITGYVEDVREYFENGMCFVAPLQMGAGIKIKVIEALSSGIPVLTNSIGIEGIFAEDKIHYYHCESADEYASQIKKIYYKEDSPCTNNAKEFIMKNYDYQQSAKEFIELVRTI